MTVIWLLRCDNDHFDRTDLWDDMHVADGFDDPARTDDSWVEDEKTGKHWCPTCAWQRSPKTDG